MELQEALSKLKSLANEATYKHNKKAGASDNQYGVKSGDLRAVAKGIKIDKDLAMQLWQTGNVDARMLAVLIINPKKLTLDELDMIVRSTDYSGVAEWVNSYLVKEHPEKEQLREGWMNDPNPWAARAGWSLTAGRVTREPDGLDIAALLDRIEKEMPAAPAPAQWTMNTTLAQIGIKFPQYRERALAIGERLGIYRDYPTSKGCTSPFAPIWISEMVNRQG